VLFSPHRRINAASLNDGAIQMKKLTIALLAATAMAGAGVPATAALAQPAFQSINQRQANLDARIDAGVRNGSLTRAEATKLRAEFQALVRMEADYRRSGGVFTQFERQDLDRRFDILSRKINVQRNDNQTAGNWQNINQRQANLEQRINQGIRNRSLTQAEAVRLRAEFRQIAALEAQYRRSGGGLTAAERADLDRRFDVLSRKITVQRNDNDNWYGSSNRLQQLGQRIENAYKARQLTRAEWSSLRSQHQYLVQLEQNYRRNGLTAAERADLNRRFELLAVKIRWQRSDWDRR
jgi:hypothetical protein